MDRTQVRATAIAERGDQLAAEADALCWDSIEEAVALDSLDALAPELGDGYVRADHLWTARGLLTEAARHLRVAGAA